MVAAFPLAKLGLLLLKQLSKPLANRIKNEAKKHPSIRKYVIIPTGKAYGWIEKQSSVRIKGMKHEELEQMTEEECIELGSNAIGEIILFGLLSAILLAEYNRQGDKKAEMQKTKDDELQNILETLLNVLEDVDNLKSDVKKIKRDITVVPDVLDLEEHRHPFVHDHNFLDVMGNAKRLFRRKSEWNRGNDWDGNSPSI